MGNGIADELAIGVLEHEADLGCLATLVHLFYGSAEERNATRALTVGGERGLHMTKQGRFAGPRAAAHHNEVSRGNRKPHIEQCRLLATRIRER